MGIIRGVHSEYKVLIGDNELDIEASRQLYRHSTDFSWGFLGSGPSQLSLALMLYYTGSRETALRFYMEFKHAVIQHLSVDSDFELDESVVKSWIAERRLRDEKD